MDKRLEFGPAFSRVFELYSANFLPLLIWSAVFQVGVAVVVGALVASVLTLGPLALLSTPVVLAVTIIGSALLTGAYIFGLAETEAGREFPSFGEVWGKITPLLGAIIATSILAGLGIIGGFILLIIPGFVLLTWWALVAPIIVLEGMSGTQALGRSRELVKGNGWTVFGLLIVVGIVTGIVGGIIGKILSTPFGSDTFIGGILNQFGSGVLTAPVSALLALVMYQTLTGAHAGGQEPGTQQTPPPAYTPPPTPPTGEDPPAPSSPITEH